MNLFSPCKRWQRTEHEKYPFDSRFMNSHPHFATDNEYSGHHLLGMPVCLQSAAFFTQV